MKDSFQEEVKSFSDSKISSNKFDFDLYKDEHNTVEKLFRVKRYGSVKTEKWKVFEDNKAIFIVDGTKLSKKEKDFLYTVEGITLLLTLAKRK